MDRPDHSFVSDDGIVRVARFGPVFAGVYATPITRAAMDQLLQWQAPVMPEEPIVSFSLAFGAQRMAPDAQAAADRVLTAYGPRTCASAIVLSASGFQASAARAMLATIHLLIRVNYARRVFATVADAQTWLLSLDRYRNSVLAAGRWLSEAEARERPASSA